MIPFKTVKARLHFDSTNSFTLRHGSATALLYLFWIVATLVMVATQTLILIRRNEIIDHFDKHASFWRNNEAENCRQSKKV